MQRFFSQDMEAAEEAGVAPTQEYTADNNAQYVQNSYGYPPPSSTFAIDQSLQMPESVDEYTTNVPTNNIQRQENGTSSLPEQNGTDDVINSHANPALNSAALPVTSAQAQTPLNSSTKRKSSDDTHEISATGGEPQSGRKRSKVSRACDQCRRKKVKCDSVVDNTGVPSTCSQCLKAGQICDFSRVPQKRGPSKGYIKELSERVQQVEGQLALQNQGYRPSLDGSTGPFPDQAFSPDEETARRQSSFSQERSPHEPPNRDIRFPNFAGYHLSNIHKSHLRDRDRGSIAVPPDQRHPEQTTPTQLLPPPGNLVKPFWTEYTESFARSQEESTPSITFDEHDMEALGHYCTHIHPQCPILPDDRARIVEIFKGADHGIQQAFLACLPMLPYIKSSESATATETATKFLRLKTRADLENFVHQEDRKYVAHRTNESNLVLLWVQLLLSIIIQHDVSSFINSNMPLATITRMPFEILWIVLKGPVYKLASKYEPDFVRALPVAALFARLHALSIGRSDDPLPLDLAISLNVGTHVVPAPFLLTTVTSNLFRMALAVCPLDGRTVNQEAALNFEVNFGSTMSTVQSMLGLTDFDPVVRQVKAFANLLSLHGNPRYSKAQCAEPAKNLAYAIRAAAALANANEGYQFNPLSFHTHTLATITLLELLQCNFQHDVAADLVEGAVKDMRSALGRLVEKREAASGGAGGRFWARVLLDLIQVKHAGGAELATRKSEEELCVDLAHLLRQGYGNVLVAFATRQQ